MNNLPKIPARRPMAHGEAMNLNSVTKETKRLPTRLFLHATQKWGKTSFAAQAPQPIFLCTRGEDGLMTLIDAGQVPAVPHFPDTFQSWPDLKQALNELIISPHDYKTPVIDTVNGVERLIQEHVVETVYGGKYDSFDAWGKAGQRLLPEIIEFTQLLDILRGKGMAVILLAHSVVRNAKNPEGLDFPRWEPPLVREIQEHFDRWCDVLLFGRLETIVEATQPTAKATRGKARGGHTRLLMTECDATYAAGNRLGLPAEIECGESAAQAWTNFVEALKNKSAQSQS